MLERIAGPPRLPRLAIAVGMGLTLACGGGAFAGCRRDPAREMGDKAAAAAQAVTLARSGRALEPPGPRARIVVGQKNLGADNTAFFGALDPAERQRLLRSLPAGEAAALPFFHESLVNLESWQPPPPRSPRSDPPRIEPLRALLASQADIERRGATFDSEGSAVNVRLHRDTPYALALQVISTATALNFKPLLIVEGVGGEGVLRLDEQPFGEKACPAPQLRIGAPGVALSIEPSVGWVVQAPPPAGSTSPAPPPPWERTIVPRAGVCPSVPRKGSLDVAALASLLRLIAAALPPCPVAMISADPRTPWQEIVAAADATAAAGFPRLRLLNAAEPPADCSGAIPVADLQGRFSTP